MLLLSWTDCTLLRLFIAHMNHYIISTGFNHTDKLIRGLFSGSERGNSLGGLLPGPIVFKAIETQMTQCGIHQDSAKEWTSIAVNHRQKFWI